MDSSDGANVAHFFDASKRFFFVGDGSCEVSLCSKLYHGVFGGTRDFFGFCDFFLNCFFLECFTFNGVLKVFELGFLVSLNLFEFR